MLTILKWITLFIRWTIKWNKKDIHKLIKAYTLSEQLITKLIQTKAKRETAQYDATPSITREMAKTSLRDAKNLLQR